MFKEIFFYMQTNIRIIQSCLQILLTQGVRVSMDDIAKELSMSKRTLYEIFENKNELIYKCISLFAKELKNKMEHYLSENNSNVIEELFPLFNYDIYNMMKKNDYFFRDIKKYYPEIFDKIIINHKELYMSHISKIISKGVGQGFFKKEINVDIVKAFLFFLITSPKEEDNEMHRKYSFTSIFENTILCYVRGISTPKGQQLIDDVLKQSYPYFENELKTVKTT